MRRQCSNLQRSQLPARALRVAFPDLIGALFARQAVTPGEPQRAESEQTQTGDGSKYPGYSDSRLAVSPPRIAGTTTNTTNSREINMIAQQLSNSPAIGVSYSANRRRIPFPEKPNEASESHPPGFFLPEFGRSGQRWIRTIEGVSQRIYSPPRLATSVSTRFGMGRRIYAGTGVHARVSREKIPRRAESPARCPKCAARWTASPARAVSVWWSAVPGVFRAG